MFLQSYIYWKARTLAELAPLVATEGQDAEYGDAVIRDIATDLNCAVAMWKNVFSACTWHGDDWDVWKALLAKLEDLKKACSDIERTHDVDTALSFCIDGRLSKAIPDMNYRRWFDAMGARVLMCGKDKFVTQPRGLSIIYSDGPRRALAAYTNSELEYLSLGFVQVRNEVTGRKYEELINYGCSWSYAQTVRCCLNEVDPLSSVLLHENEADEVMRAIWRTRLRVCKKYGM